MDLIRDLLLKIGGRQRSFDLLPPEIAEILGVSSEGRLPREQAELLEYHLTLLDNAGLITIQAKLSGAVWQIGQITWAGHNFLDTIRDPAIWRETKVGVKQAGGFSLDLLKALAKGLIKKKTSSTPALTWTSSRRGSGSGQVIMLT
ncbi:DUF2513 domain-containing protein [Novosphingobium sp. Fuku2-ISO-50]|uniref:DUF2513 domain-containing protein n=1 Tax=Novosphingobium sp. Fuku2-ISO-50 TaxID=1739114 RepID=UPI001E511148|nr:DUF2513 domain-containing protein [Novosphingobium sp. Fuku2-ISO-50]